MRQNYNTIILNSTIMEKIKNFIAQAKYDFKCIKLTPYAVMYKDEAEASRRIISDLKAQNRVLMERYKAQTETVSRLLEAHKAQTETVSRLLEMIKQPAPGSLNG